MNRRTQVDLLHGPIMKSLVLFMIPIVISNIFQQFYNAVDTAIVGNFLGETSLAAIGSCSAVFEMLVNFSMSLGNGFSIVCGRSFGSGDEDTMKKSVAGAMMIGFVTCIVISLLSVFALKPLLQLIHTPAAVIDESYSYIRVIGLGIIVMFSYNLCSGMLRAIGNSVMPLVFLIISSLLNIVLDILLITAFNMGVVGAAVATVIAQGVSVVLCVIYILTRTRILVPEARHFKIESHLMKDLAGQGFSMAAMGSIVSVGSIILQSGINSLGTEIIAGHVAARKIYAICNLPFISMGVAISTFISQNRGAGQGDRILTAMRDAYIYDIALAFIVSLILFPLAPTFVRLISGSSNPVILNNGAKMLRIVGPFYAVLGVLMQTRFALQGLGSKLIPLISSVIELIGKILFVTIFIPRFAYDAVVWCEPLIWVAMTAQLLYAFNTNPFVKETRRNLRAAS
ncbi:MAG: MATE family efflux transporter [Erysipelotrichaceae bacterium]|nr:MATE family efflux transporter [Erysipelotrichaceae bacterium]